jgi:hypothetical protein
MTSCSIDKTDNAQCVSETPANSLSASQLTTIIKQGRSVDSFVITAITGLSEGTRTRYFFEGSLTI